MVVLIRVLYKKCKNRIKKQLNYYVVNTIPWIKTNCKCVFCKNLLTHFERCIMIEHELKIRIKAWMI